MRKSQWAVALAVFILALAFCFAPFAVRTALAVTLGNGDGTYDFDIYQIGPNSSAGTGYIKIGDKFKAPNSTELMGVAGAAGTATALVYYPNNTGSGALILQAENGSVCRSFTFKNLGLSYFDEGLGVLKFASATLILKDASGVQISSTPLGSSNNLSTTQITTLSSLYNCAAWNVANVGYVELDFTLNVSSAAATDINLENITLADVYGGTPISISSAAVTGSITPARGQTPATATALTAAEPIKFTVNSLVWKTTGGLDASFTGDGKFLEGTQYVAEISLTAGANFTFGSSVSATLNAQAATVASNTNASSAGNTIIIRYTFPATASLSTITIHQQPTVMSYLSGETLNLAGLIAALNYSDSNSEYVPLLSFSSKGITVSPAEGTILSVATHNNTKIAVSKGTVTGYTDALSVENLTYTVSVNPTSLDFDSVIGTYSAPAAQTVTVTNTGNSNITLQQPSITNYTVGTLSTASLAPNGTATFTVRPNTGLSAGNYNATLTVSTNQSTSAQVGLTFSVVAATYTIDVDQSTLSFADVVEGYAAPNTQTVTVTNTGNSGVTLQQPSVTNYTMGTLSSSGLAPNATATFTVRPNTGLGAAPHNATLTVSTNQGTSAQVGLSFLVAAPSYTISVNPTNLDFGSVLDSYVTAPAAQTVTVTNTGNSNITLQQPSLSNYTVGTLSTDSLVPHGTATFTVRPNTGLSTGNYDATLTVSTGQSTSAQVGLSFSVADASYTITVNPTSLDFGGAIGTYSAPAAQTVTITNTGNSNITLQQPSITNYTVGTLSTASLAPNGTATFTVRPNTGLSAGNYDATLTVSTNQSTSAQVGLSFLVTAASYTITISPTSLDFGNILDSYVTAPAAQTVTVTNTGNSNITLQQPSLTNYTVGTLSTTSIAPFDSATFTVQPNTGLSAGNYDATLTVSTGQSTSAQAGLSFSVTASTYTVSVNPTSLDFGSDVYGYTAAPAAQTVTVTNTGNSNVTLQQPTATAYAVGTLSAASLVPNGTATFTVQPKIGLYTGSQDETITVYTDQSTSAQVSVAYTVQAVNHGYSADPTTVDFGTSIVGYAAAPAARTITIINTGNVSLTLRQPTSTSYDIGTLSALTLLPNTTATFTVQPKTGLTAGTYSETIRVYPVRTLGLAIDVSFVVESANNALSAAPTSLDFGTLTVGYAAAPSAQTVTVTNESAAAVTLQQPTATHFDVGTLSIGTLVPGGSATFTVRPKTGLATGSYDENIDIHGDSDAVTSTRAVFAVGEASTYSISVTPTDVVLSTLAVGYLQPAGETVVVTNTGNQSLTLYQPTSGYFTVGALSANTLAPGEHASFTLTPQTGLSVGTWNETIHVYGDHGATASVQATFQCVTGQDYTILSGNGSVFQYGGDGTLTIVASGALGDFTGLTLNGAFLGAGNYDVSSGSTIVTLHHNYLAALSPGTYTLVYHYTNGRAQATFVIADKTAQTGDNDALAIFGLIAALSCAGLILLARRRKQARW